MYNRYKIFSSKYTKLKKMKLSRGFRGNGVYSKTPTIAAGDGTFLVFSKN